LAKGIRLRIRRFNGTSILALQWGFTFLLLTIVPQAGAQTNGTQSLVGRRAPEFVRRDLTGHNLDLARLRGKVVLLNFWATWCAPCQIEMPMFDRWQEQYRPQQLAVIGISMDDDSEPVRRMIYAQRIDYPVAMGDARLGQRYGGVLGLPLTFLIDRNGIVRAKFQGETDLGKIEASLRSLLASH
jgi:cytochrome c biogenesis protein CcmG/thiol:disulfide interchange protein DsbE